MSEHESRAQKVAEASHKKKILRSKDSDFPEYSLLLVKSATADEVCRYLELSEKLAADVARLLDVVAEQSSLVGRLVTELEELRAEVEQVRSEKLVTDSLKELQSDIKTGGSVKGYQARLKFHRKERASATGASKVSGKESSSMDRAREFSGALGKIHSIISGASLSGAKKDFDEKEMFNRIQMTWSNQASSDTQAEGEIKIEEFIHLEHKRM